MKNGEMTFFEHHKEAFIGGAVITAIHNLVSTPSMFFLYGQTLHEWLFSFILKCIELAIYGLIGGFVGMLGKKLFTKYADKWFK